MASRRSAVAVPIAEFAAALLAQPEVRPRAQITANQVAELFPGTGVAVYVVEDQENPAWTAKATTGEITVAEVMEFHEGTLGAVAENKTLQVFDVANLKREDFAHLDVRRTMVSLAYVPLLIEETLVGVIELANYEHTFSSAALQGVQDLAALASPAIATAISYESERNASLESISRVTQM